MGFVFIRNGESPNKKFENIRKFLFVIGRVNYTFFAMLNYLNKKFLSFF